MCRKIVESKVMQNDEKKIPRVFELTFLLDNKHYLQEIFFN